MQIPDRGEKWYFRNSIMIIAFLSFGPLALPLLWFHPRLSRKAKAMITVAVLVATYLFGLILARSLQSIIRYYQPVFQDIISL